MKDYIFDVGYHICCIDCMRGNTKLVMLLEDKSYRTI